MSTEQTNYEISLDVPEKVTVSLKNSMLEVSGPLGKTFKSFKKIPISIVLDKVERFTQELIIENINKIIKMSEKVNRFVLKTF